MVFRPGRGRGPVVVTEIGVLRAGREDQVVVGNAAALGDHLAPRRVDARHLAEHDIDVPRARQDAADRRGDVGRREPGGRHLIEQRLEQVIVVLVDDGDVERLPASALAADSPPKPAPTMTTRGLVMAISPYGPSLSSHMGAAGLRPAIGRIVSSCARCAKRTANGDENEPLESAGRGDPRADHGRAQRRGPAARGCGELRRV